MSVSEPTADFAVGEFAEGGGDKRRSEDRKLFVSAFDSFPQFLYTKNSHYFPAFFRAFSA